MAQYGCSRMTVNKVLGLLADAGMIERRRRTGSFVARQHPHLEQVALSIPDIEVEMTTRGHAYRFSLLSRQLRNVRQRVPQNVRWAAPARCWNCRACTWPTAARLRWSTA